MSPVLAITWFSLELGRLAALKENRSSSFCSRARKTLMASRRQSPDPSGQNKFFELANDKMMVTNMIIVTEEKEDEY